MGIFKKEPSSKGVQDRLEALTLKHAADERRDEERAKKTLEIVRTNTRSDVEAELRREMHKLMGISRKSKAIEVKFTDDKPEYRKGRLTGHLESARGKLTLKLTDLNKEVTFPFELQYSKERSLQLFTPDGDCVIFKRETHGFGEWAGVSTTPAQGIRAENLLDVIKEATMAPTLSDVDDPTPVEPTVSKSATEIER